MMRKKAVTIKQAQRLDKRAIEKIGVPSLALMENAGNGVAKEVLKALKNKKTPLVSIFCGLGNNAGDGFVIARHLVNAGVKVKVFVIGKGSKLKADAATNYRILKKLKYPVKEIKKLDRAIVQDIKKSAVVVDAIFGVGLSRTIGEPFKAIIEAINAHARNIIAVDVPSGLNGTTGEIYGTSIKANKTVTFVLCKKGFLIRQGPGHTGRVIVIDIGIPKKLIGKL